MTTQTPQLGPIYNIYAIRNVNQCSLHWCERYAGQFFDLSRFQCRLSFGGFLEWVIICVYIYIYICWNLWFGDPHFKKTPWILFICPTILRLELGPSSKLEAPQDPKLNYRATLQQRQGILPQAGSSTGRNRHGEVRRIQPLGAKGRGCLLGKTWATSMEIQPMDICECPTS